MSKAGPIQKHMMKTIELDPNQIITLNDYPLYSHRVFNMYLDRCINGEDLPFVPVMCKDIVSAYFKVGLSRKFQEFEKRNPAATYFMLDGSHRTTALALSGRQIKAVVYESDRDIQEARQRVKTGFIVDNGTLYHTLVENCEILNNHFEEKPYFMTVRQKTDKLVLENYIVLPGLASLELNKHK